jgi:hypothetical protein
MRKTPRKAERKTTRRKTTRREASPARWSQRVMEESDALDLRQGVFTLADPKKIAASLKGSAKRSSRRKVGAYRASLSILTFYINRAGWTLPKAQRERLQRAKLELRRQLQRQGPRRSPPRERLALGARVQRANPIQRLRQEIPGAPSKPAIADLASHIADPG